MSDKRGQIGSLALKKSALEKVKENKKKLIKSLKYFKDLKIPIVKTQLSKQSGLSIATLNRSPYKEMIKEYQQEEKVLLSPNARQEFTYLINENKKLKLELEEWKEKYKRLKKEIIYSEELFK